LQFSVKKMISPSVPVDM